MPPPPPVVAALSPAAAASEPVELALALSDLSGAPLVVVVVVARGRWRAGGDAGEVRVARAVWHTERELARRGIRGADIRVVEDDTPARGLARMLDRLRPALIAVGARRAAGPGEPRLGTTARRVLHVSSCPVAMVPHGYRRPSGGVRAVGVAFVPTADGCAALRAAAAIVRSGAGRLRAVQAIHPTESRGADPDADLREALAELAADVPVDVELRVGAPAEALAAASAQLDLLVVGSRASGPPRAVRLGIVSRAVVDQARCPVLVLPRAEPARLVGRPDHDDRAARSLEQPAGRRAEEPPHAPQPA